jgi:hypothetical protein
MTQYVMQARSTTSGEMVSWITPSPDFAGDTFPGPGSPEYIAATIIGDPFEIGPASGRFVTTNEVTTIVPIAPVIPVNSMAIIDVALMFGAVVVGEMAGGRYDIRARFERGLGAGTRVSGGTDLNPDPDVDALVNTVFCVVDLDENGAPSLFINGIASRIITWSWQASRLYQTLSL